MRRTDNAAALTWLHADSGLAYPGLEHLLHWSRQTPDDCMPDLPGIVFVRGPAEIYADAELAHLARFARKATARYDTLHPHRLGCNAIVLAKLDDGRWLRKRLTWDTAIARVDTLAEALVPFELEYPLEGRWVMFQDRSIYRAGPGCMMDTHTLRALPGAERVEMHIEHMLYPARSDGRTRPIVTFSQEDPDRLPIAIANTRDELLTLTRQIGSTEIGSTKTGSTETGSTETEPAETAPTAR